MTKFDFYRGLSLVIIVFTIFTIGRFWGPQYKESLRNYKCIECRRGLFYK